MWFKYMNPVMTLILLVAAVIQYNDPDAVRWMLVYGLAAGLSAAHGRLGRAEIPAAAALGMLALVWAITLAMSVGPGFQTSDLVRSMDPDEPQIEIAREAGGLLIVAFWMAVLTIRSRSAAGKRWIENGREKEL